MIVRGNPRGWDRCAGQSFTGTGSSARDPSPCPAAVLVACTDCGRAPHGVRVDRIPAQRRVGRAGRKGRRVRAQRSSGKDTGAGPRTEGLSIESRHRCVFEASSREGNLTPESAAGRLLAHRVPGLAAVCEPAVWRATSSMGRFRRSSLTTLTGQICAAQASAGCCAWSGSGGRPGQAPGCGRQGAPRTR